MTATPFPYVVLHHTGHGPAHFDLMVATDAAGPLLTWRLATWPCDDLAAAEPIATHRRAYLNYEGDITGGRGRVTRVDSGACVVVERSAQRVVLSLDERRVTLAL